MSGGIKPGLLHHLWKCERCGAMEDCTYNTTLDRWLCAGCAMQSPSNPTDYAWSSVKRARIDRAV
jgi:hypothetical protein